MVARKLFCSRNNSIQRFDQPNLSAHTYLPMKAVVALIGVGVAGAVKLSSYTQGAAFDKCINITDFETKTLADDITLHDRESDGGCCPKGTVPGAKWKDQYQGAQVVCGFKSDGKIATSTSNSNGKKTCTYNKCYVHKQNLGCKGDTHTVQKLNGCCGVAKKKADVTFKDLCSSYFYSFKNVHNENAGYCASFHKNWGKLGKSGTADKTDDQKDDKLVVDKVQTFTLCVGSEGNGTTSGDGTSGDGDGASVTTSNFATQSSLGAAFFLAAIGIVMH